MRLPNGMLNQAPAGMQQGMQPQAQPAQQQQFQVPVQPQNQGFGQFSAPNQVQQPAPAVPETEAQKLENYRIQLEQAQKQMESKADLFNMLHNYGINTPEQLRTVFQNAVASTQTKVQDNTQTNDQDQTQDNSLNKGRDQGGLDYGDNEEVASLKKDMTEMRGFMQHQSRQLHIKSAKDDIKDFLSSGDNAQKYPYLKRVLNDGVVSNILDHINNHQQKGMGPLSLEEAVSAANKQFENIYSALKPQDASLKQGQQMPNSQFKFNTPTQPQSQPQAQLQPQPQAQAPAPAPAAAPANGGLVKVPASPFKSVSQLPADGSVGEARPQMLDLKNKQLSRGPVRDKYADEHYRAYKAAGNTFIDPTRDGLHGF